MEGLPKTEEKVARARKGKFINDDTVAMAVAISRYLAPQYSVASDAAVAGAVKFLYDSLVHEGKITHDRQD